MEIELKLTLPDPEAEAGIVGLLTEHGYRVEEGEEEAHEDLYLDTFDWSLRKEKLALRYRTAGPKAMYTLKSMGSMVEGIAKRMEVEVPLERPVPFPTEDLPKPIRKIVAGVIFPRKLLEQVLVRTDRRRYPVLSPEGAKLELAFDLSSFFARGLHFPQRAKKLHELEAELLDGPEAAVRSLASLLASSYSYAPSNASMLETALARLRIPFPSKQAPERLRVRLDDRLDFAVQKILSYQFLRFREQLPGVQRDIDPEFVHQARVAARRMRSAFRLFREVLSGSTADYLQGELKWLGALFGTVRDLDVFLLNLSRFKPQIQRFPGKEKKAFENWVEKQRRAPLKALKEALGSRRYRTFERRFDPFLTRRLPARPRSPATGRPVREAAPSIIPEKMDAVLRQGKEVLARPKLKKFHRLRIEMKRLRYALEFMAPAYEGALDPVIERTVEIQDCLGDLQDSVFTRKFIETLFEDWKGKLVKPELVFILGEIYQLQAEIEGDRRKRFGQIWERFSSEETINLLQEVLLAPRSPR
jgi:triphosphatase